MASTSVVLLSLALVVIAIASPVPSEEAETTTAAADVPLVEVIEIIETIVPEDDATTTDATTKDAVHKVAKRSVLRGDNPSNDLLADLDGLKYENGLTSLAGRRIKFLPTWLG